MPYILERHVLNQQQPRNSQILSNIPRPIKQLNLNTNGGISHASKPTTEKLPLVTPAKAPLKDLSISQDDHRSKTVPLDPNPELAVLELVPFGQQPIVNFGTILLGTTRIKYITIRNPDNRQQQLFVSSMPKSEKGFNIEATEFLIAPRTEICVAVACTPRLVGAFRETITLQDVHRMSKKIILLGSSVRPKQELIQMRPTRRIPIPRIYHQTPAKHSRQHLSGHGNMKFSPRVTTIKTKREVKPLTKLQSPSPKKRHQIVRAVIARRDYPIKVKAATIIQKYYRGHLDRRRYTAFKLMRRELEIFERTTAAATVIQKHFKRYTARQDFLRSKSAAIVIQKHFKGYTARQDFLRRKSAAIIIQKHFKRYTARQDFLRRKSAAIVIQKHFKGYTARQDFLRSRSAAIVIQKHFKGYTARQDFLRSRSSAIVIQKHFKGYTARQDFLRRKSAAIVIQKHFKGYTARQEFLRSRSSAIVIQKHFKGYTARQDFLRRKSAAIVIQKHFKRYTARQDFLRSKSAAIVIQKHFKGYTARQDFLRRKSAAIVIQKHFKGLLARRERARLRSLLLSTIRMQSHVRGYLCRNRLRKSIRAIQSIQQRALGVVRCY